MWVNNFSNVGAVSVITQKGSISSDAFTIPAAGSVNVVTLADVTNVSTYDLSIYLYTVGQGNAGSSLTVPVTLKWYDDLTSGIPVYQEEWDIWVANNSGTGGPPPVGTAFGTGPMRGKYFTVTVSELGGANSVICRFVNLYGSNRTQIGSNWRQAPPGMSSNGVVYYGTTTQSDATLNNSLQNLNGILAASSTVWVANGLYSGPAWLHLHVQTVALLNSVCLAACDPRLITSGGIVAGNTIGGILSEISADTLTHEFTIALPRTPTLIVLHNGTTQQSFDFSLTGQEIV